DDVMTSVYEADYYTVPIPAVAENQAEYIPADEVPKIIKALKKQMKSAAERLDFEEAAHIRDRIKAISEDELRWV
ncbi:MAG: UvrB/UvrC motif-containing protein, partial [Deltaproteobacteria bacterium]|nr:UvrB/UvrC motif-containing protein [Deltaproteobacteria bacterium]